MRPKLLAVPHPIRTKRGLAIIFRDPGSNVRRIVKFPGSELVPGVA